MGPFTVNSSGIVGFETNESGHIMYGRINAIPSGGLDTTANTYGVGCVIVDSSTGVQWINTGSAASPVWTLYNGFQQVTVSAAQIPLMFGGTNVVILPAPPTGKSIVVNDFAIEYVGAGGTAYTGGGSTVQLLYGTYGTTTGSSIANYIGMGTSVFYGTATKMYQGPSPVTTAGTVVPAGLSLLLANTTAAFGGGGTSSLKVSLWYSIIPV